MNTHFGSGFGSSGALELESSLESSEISRGFCRSRCSRPRNRCRRPLFCVAEAGMVLFELQRCKGFDSLWIDVN